MISGIPIYIYICKCMYVMICYMKYITSDAIGVHLLLSLCLPALLWQSAVIQGQPTTTSSARNPAAKGMVHVETPLGASQSVSYNMLRKQQLDSHRKQIQRERSQATSESQPEANRTEVKRGKAKRSKANRGSEAAKRSGQATRKAKRGEANQPKDPTISAFCLTR